MDDGNRGPSVLRNVLTRCEERTAHRLLLEVDRVREGGITTMQSLAKTLNESGVRTPRGRPKWTHTTVTRLLGRTGALAFSCPVIRVVCQRTGQYNGMTSRFSPPGRQHVNVRPGSGRQRISSTAIRPVASLRQRCHDRNVLPCVRTPVARSRHPPACKTLSIP